MLGFLESVCFGPFLCILGSITALYYVLMWSWSCWQGFRVHVLSRIWQTDLTEYGQWAVVTGATSGIGQAYAMELAKRGLDIVLISRSPENLCRVAKDIESRYGRQTRIIQTDFTEGHSIYPAIAEQLRGLEIGILVNNVGMTYSGLMIHFLDVPDPAKRITDVINCNVLSVTQVHFPPATGGLELVQRHPWWVEMSRLILPRMVDRGKGLIINMSSEAGSQPQPMLAMYSASKIFVTYFSQCLHAEYSPRGITVQCLIPFMVSTNMTHNVKVNPLVKSAASYAWDALNTVGYSSYTSGCISHALQHIALDVFLPAWLRLSPFYVQLTEKFAQTLQQTLEKQMPQSCQKQE